VATRTPQKTDDTKESSVATFWVKPVFLPKPTGDTLFGSLGLPNLVRTLTFLPRTRSMRGRSAPFRIWRQRQVEAARARLAWLVCIFRKNTNSDPGESSTPSVSDCLVHLQAGGSCPLRSGVPSRIGECSEKFGMTESLDKGEPAGRKSKTGR